MRWTGRPEVGAYLTDEVFLYRVDDVLTAGAEQMAALEDCCSLDVVRVSMADLRARRLRVVTPAHGGVQPRRHVPGTTTSLTSAT
jgi:hypothetical protein